MVKSSNGHIFNFGRILIFLTTLHQGHLTMTLVLSSLQFLVAPYSLFVSLALALALCPPIYGCHYLVYSLLGAASSALAPGLCPQFVTDIVTYIAAIPAKNVRILISI